MGFFSARSEADTESSQAVIKWIGQELADLFQALDPIVATNFESYPLDHPLSLEALAEAEQLLSAYFRAIQLGVCIVDREFRFVAINKTLAQMNGVPAAQHLGKTVREMLGEGAELIEPQFQRVLQGGEPVLNIEISLVLPNQTEPGHWIEHYIPIKDAAGEIQQIGVVALEVTEQKRLEESLRKVSHNLREEKKRLQVLGEVGRLLSAKREVGQVFSQISAHLRRIFRQEYAALPMRDEGTGKLTRL